MYREKRSMTEDELREMTRSNYAVRLEGLGYGPDRMALAEQQGHWIRPFGSTMQSHIWECSECRRTVYYVPHGPKGQRPACAYPNCPWCKKSMKIDT